ncbi:MAG: type II toxin-antitoxin system RelE/ParE family toxin [Pseudorhodoferax sp.]
MPLVFSPAAAADLEEIGDFIAQDNPLRAISFLQELRVRCARLARSPGIGTARPELGDGVRSMPHGRYLIFYRAQDAMLRVERVLHGARDIGQDDFASDSNGDD